MGTLSHRQAKATEFLHRADRAIAALDPLMVSLSNHHPELVEGLSCRKPSSELSRDEERPTNVARFG